MKKKYQKFLVRLTILSLILGLLAYLLNRFLPDGIISPALPYLLLLFYFVNAIVHYVLLRITLMNPRKFVSYFMLATFLKLMNYLIVIVVYVFFVKSGILQFILAFFALYIFYTIFEVVTILVQTKE